MGKCATHFNAMGISLSLLMPSLFLSTADGISPLAFSSALVLPYRNHPMLISSFSKKIGPCGRVSEIKVHGSRHSPGLPNVRTAKLLVQDGQHRDRDPFLEQHL